MTETTVPPYTKRGKKHIVDLGGEEKDHVKEKAGATGEKIGEVIDPDLYHDKIEISLKHKSYKNISVDEAAKMLGYFTQKMQNAGFPWGVYEVKGDNLKKERADKRDGSTEAASERPGDSSSAYEKPSA